MSIWTLILILAALLIVGAAVHHFSGQWKVDPNLVKVILLVLLCIGIGVIAYACGWTNSLKGMRVPQV